jgi:hypothetical protein
MKKESLFNGVRAKTTLAIVALSSALFTGCYKDGGLDVNGVTLSAPSYTITGQVVDAETFSPIASATVSGDISATVTNGAFSSKVETAKVYTLSVAATGYTTSSVSVDVKAVNAGQSAIYPVIVALQPLYDGLYTINFEVRNSEGTLLNASDYTVAITQFGQTAAVQNGQLKGGNTYVVNVTADGYVPQYITVELPKSRVAATKDLSVTLNKKAVGKVVLYGDVTLFDEPINARKIVLSDAQGNVLGLASGYAYRFEVDEDLFTEVEATTKASTVTRKSATFKFGITDETGITYTFDKTYTISTSSSSDSSSEDTVVNSDVNIEVAVDLKSDVSYVIKESTVSSNYCNEEETSEEVKIEYNPYVGTSREVSNAPEGNDIFAKAMRYAMGEAVDGLVQRTDSVATVKYTIPAQSVLVSFNLQYVGVKIVRTFNGFTVNGQEVEIESFDTDDYSDLIGKYTTTTTHSDGSVAITDPEIQEISHDHGHGHGHGDSNNAGGGIIYAE